MDCIKRRELVGALKKKSHPIDIHLKAKHVKMYNVENIISGKFDGSLVWSRRRTSSSFLSSFFDS